MPLQTYLRNWSLDLWLYIFSAIKKMDLFRVRIPSLETLFDLHDRN